MNLKQSGSAWLQFVSGVFFTTDLLFFTGGEYDYYKYEDLQQAKKTSFYIMFHMNNWQWFIFIVNFYMII